MYVQLYVIFVVYYLFWNKLIGRMSLGLGAQESRAGRACPCCSSILTLEQFVFELVHNSLNWYKIFELVQNSTK